MRPAWRTPRLLRARRPQLSRPFALACALTVWGCDGALDPNGDRDFRQEMRDFVGAISASARAQDPDFAVIIQNGHEILTLNGEPDGELATELVAAIDGVGREDLFYGYTGDDLPTPAPERDYMLGLTERARESGLAVLVTDYCATRAFVDDSYARNGARGYASFAADRRDLDNIPAYPPAPHGVSTADVISLDAARNFLYLINPEGFPAREAFLEALGNTDYDLVLVDLFYDDQALSAAEVAGLKRKANGGSRLVIAYMSVGEAEDYRYYWSPAWDSRPPGWLAAENPHWPGNYKVRYWEKDWQAIIYGSEDAYLERVLAAGFDGVYLDIIDAFEYFGGPDD